MFARCICTVQLHTAIAHERTGPRPGPPAPPGGARAAPSPPALSPALPSSSIPATGSGRSTGMIALTSILSILFAVLLAGLVAMLFFWG